MALQLSVIFQLGHICMELVYHESVLAVVWILSQESKSELHVLVQIAKLTERHLPLSKVESTCHSEAKVSHTCDKVTGAWDLLLDV